MSTKVTMLEVSTPSDAGKHVVSQVCEVMAGQLEAQQFHEFLTGGLAACAAHLATSLGAEPAARLIHAVAESTLEAAQVMAIRRQAH